MGLPLMSDELKSELLALIREGRTVAAIKKLREETGLPLRMVKEWVDARRAEITLPPQNNERP